MKHMVRYYYPGSFMSEESTHELSCFPGDRVAEAARLAPDHAYCFVLYDVDLPDPAALAALGERFTVVPKHLDETGRYYLPGAREYDVDGVQGWGESTGEDVAILVSNMRGNGWSRVVRTRKGNWQPLMSRDVVL